LTMTVCIAAICDETGIVGASDRMLTSGDVEFEPDFDSLPTVEFPPGLHETFTRNGKIRALTNRIVGLTAGDAGLQSEIMQEVLSAMMSQLPDKWWTVKETVDLYVNAYDSAKRKRAQTAI